jgi:hypothetical protein
MNINLIYSLWNKRINMGKTEHCNETLIKNRTNQIVYYRKIWPGLFPFSNV